MTQQQHKSRLRFRNHVIKTGAVAYTVRDSIFELAGVLKVEVSKRTGSILVIFNKAQIAAEDILNKIANTLDINSGLPGRSLRRSKHVLKNTRSRSLVKKGLLVTGAVTLGSLTFSKKAHLIAGATLVGFAGLHMMQNNKNLLK